MKILVFSGCYLPGYRAGGPTRSVANLVNALNGDIQFTVVTNDRDVGDVEPYPIARTSSPVVMGGAEVFYLHQRHQSVSRFARVMRQVGPDLVYLNSFFSPRYTMLPLLARLRAGLSHTPVVLAPRGEFSPGALKLRGLKKRVYLSAFKGLGWQHRLVWHATSEYEAADIRRVVGSNVELSIAPNIPGDPGNVARNSSPKTPGKIRLVFLSRIAPMKNLALAVSLLGSVRGEIEFNIYGPVWDSAYWRQCRRIIEELPPNVDVRYHGPVNPIDVSEVFGSHHLFLLPTLGENYGHVIQESLVAGCPVLISDQTPWRGLQAAGAGWDLPLDQRSSFCEALQQCIDCDAAQHAHMSESARLLALHRSEGADHVGATRELFMRAASRGRRTS